ncbi:hypothetical protein EIP86_010131 [Pleurotus ostreatoroseus]|nr:hypothetical protein EIP86_010131 [Pleurotus ostreatoroseus]
MALLPQAYALVLQQAYFLLSPAIVLIVLGKTVVIYTGLNTPLWIIALAAVFSLPLLHRAKAFYDMWLMRKKASRIGATLPPEWAGKKMGSVDIMKLLMKSWHEGYLSENDLISRFTLDSATEFLFGACVDSLESSLPYPYHAPPDLREQPLTKAEEFARAFAQAQTVISERVRTGRIWPYYELSGSRTEESMRVVDSFITPILQEALKKHKDERDSGKPVQGKDGDVEDGETLLANLVRYTTGKSFRDEDIGAGKFD